MINLYSGLIGGITYELLDSGIANLLVVDTLRHGTHFFNYASIRLQGGDPNQGGKSTGSTKNWREDNTENLFYIFKGNEYRNKHKISYEFEDMIYLPIELNFIATRLLSRLHVLLSSYNFAARITPKKPSFFFVKCTRIFLVLISGMITPTLRFRFSAIDPDRFKNDPKYDGCAYLTAKKVEAWRIGMLGSFITGINLNCFVRIKNHPVTFLTGVTQIAVAIAIGDLFITILLANPYLILPATIGALLI